jgi:hypothetical protein
MPRKKRTSDIIPPHYSGNFVVYVTTPNELTSSTEPGEWECDLQVLSYEGYSTQGEAEFHAYNAASDRAKQDSGSLLASTLLDFEDRSIRRAIYRVNFRDGSYAIYGAFPTSYLNVPTAHDHLTTMYAMLRTMHTKPAPSHPHIKGLN